MGSPVIRNVISGDNLVRIISGQLKGRKLMAVRGNATRPTSDRVREALFNILAQTPIDAAVLDLYAGTGALGIEAISRGAQSAVFVDSSAQALNVLRKNIHHCGLETCTQTIQWNISKNLNCLMAFEHKFDLVFMDPPYGQHLAVTTLKHLLDSRCLATGARVVVEHELNSPVDPTTTALICEDSRRYGKTRLTFFAYRPDKPNPVCLS